jgi:AI-2 transport protein TqsA
LIIDSKAVVAAAWLWIVVLTGSLLVWGREVLIPLALAVLIWQLLNALAAAYRRVRILGQTAPRWARFVLAVLTLGVAFWLAARVIGDNIGRVTLAAPAYQANLERALPAVLAFFGQEQMPTLAQLLGQLDVSALISRVSATLANLLGNTGLVALYVTFMLFEQESFGRKLDALFPDTARAAGVRLLLERIETRVEAYLRIKTALSTVTGVLSWVVLVAVGVDYAEFWALLVFLLNFIPTIGSIFAVIFPTLLTLLQFMSLGPVLLVAVALGIVQFVIGNLVEPQLMGSSLNLSPLVMIVSLALWGSLWGIAGLFLCVPIMVILMIVFAHFAPTRPVAILMSSNGRVD